MGKYKTDNLDLAAYLLTKGYEPLKTKYKSAILCEYTYPVECEKLAKSFFLGNVQCDLQKFLYARYFLKQLTKKLASIQDKKETKDYKEQYAEFNGNTYWFLGSNGLVHQAIFENNKRHIDRKEAGNYYPSESLAKLASKAKVSQSSGGSS